MSHLGQLRRPSGMKTATLRTPTGPFAALDGSTTVLLITFRRDGRRVGTPVRVAWDGERAFFRTRDSSAKLSRMWRDPRVEIAPCTARGRMTGPTVPARSRILAGAEAAEARSRLAPTFPLPRAVHVELTPR